MNVTQWMMQADSIVNRSTNATTNTSKYIPLRISVCFRDVTSYLFKVYEFRLNTDDLVMVQVIV